MNIFHLHYAACECVQEAKTFNIPNVVKGEYVRKAVEVVNTSYNQSEMFTSVRFHMTFIVKFVNFIYLSHHLIHI